LRLHNYAEEDPVTGKPYTTKGLSAAYTRGAELFGWEHREARRHANARSGKRIGFGMASQVWGGGGGPPAYALAKLNPDGTVVVVTGTQDIGTGIKTALAQIAAEAFGCAVPAVEVKLGDTQLGLYAPISAGSMTLASVGPAVYAAALDARRRLIDVAAQILERPPKNSK
jgi:xanthine dehydrogenase YagR molybdenum-binding subunit